MLHLIFDVVLLLVGVTGNLCESQTERLKGVKYIIKSLLTFSWVILMLGFQNLSSKTTTSKQMVH